MDCSCMENVFLEIECRVLPTGFVVYSKKRRTAFKMSARLYYIFCQLGTVPTYLIHCGGSVPGRKYANSTPGADFLV